MAAKTNLPPIQAEGKLWKEWMRLLSPSPPGGLDTMEYDIAIPEKYGIYDTDGDTAGPVGWSRAIRKIPVFKQFAEDFEEICPTAFIANYSNPMSALTATLAGLCSNPVVGLCHSYFKMKDVIQQVFNLNDTSQLSLSIAGLNHFTWLVDFKFGKKDGYPMLREKIGKGSLRELLQQESVDDKGYVSMQYLCAELFDLYGYLPLPADRHICEFLSYTMSGNPERRTVVTHDGETQEEIEYCNLKRTSISQRRSRLVKREKRIRDMIGRFSEKAPSQMEKSRETGAEMLFAYLNNKAMTEAVNTINVGQIPGLPMGACVETFGMIDGLGIRPVSVDHVPEQVLELMRPQSVCQKWITEGAVKCDKRMLLQVLCHDPQCSHLKARQIEAMAN